MYKVACKKATTSAYIAVRNTRDLCLELFTHFTIRPDSYDVDRFFALGDCPSGSAQWEKGSNDEGECIVNDTVGYPGNDVKERVSCTGEDIGDVCAIEYGF